MSRLDFCQYELVDDCYDWKNDNCDECNIFKAYYEGARRAKNSIVRCEALSNYITESPNDVVESQNDVIKKPRTVRYKLHKPIEYVSIEFDEEEEITHIDHYTAYGERRAE